MLTPTLAPPTTFLIQSVVDESGNARSSGQVWAIN